MSNMRRWDPFGEMMTLRDAMNQLFEDSMVSPSRSGTSGNTLAMPLNIRETEDGFQVEAVVPGLQPDDLNITIHDNVLTISGETRQEQKNEGKQGNWHVMERRYGRFSRSVSLPTTVKADDVQASLENGILHLEIPKAEQVRPRKIAVQSRQLSGQTLDVEPHNGQQREQGA